MQFIRSNLLLLLHRSRSRSRSTCIKVNRLRSKSCFRCFSHTPCLLKLSGTSSHQWMQRQLKDPFVKRAHEENYRCRSAFKLLQIDDKYHIFQPGFTVIDCGSAPGSWTQVAVERVNSNGADVSKPQGFVIGIDLQTFSPIEGAVILSACDFTKKDTQDKVRNIMEGNKANVIVSDMAPRASGIKSHNHQVIVDLCFSVLRFSLGVLEKDGTLLCKLWMGGQQQRLEKAMKSVFARICTVKPEASRNDSAEIFLLAQGFLGLKTR